MIRWWKWRCACQKVSRAISRQLATRLCVDRSSLLTGRIWLQNGAKVCKQWLTLFSRCPKAYHQQFLTLTDTLSLSYQTCKLWQTFEILFPAGCLHWTGQGWNMSTPSFSLQPAFVTRFARLCLTCVAGGAGNKLDGMIKLLEMYIQDWILKVQ